MADAIPQTEDERQARADEEARSSRVHVETEDLCGCAICGAHHLYGVNVEEAASSEIDADLTPEQKIRIAALNAAAAIVAGATFGSEITIQNGEAGTDRFTIALARQFMPFLKDG